MKIFHQTGFEIARQAATSDKAPRSNHCAMSLSTHSFQQTRKPQKLTNPQKRHLHYYYFRDFLLLSQRRQP